MNKYLDLFREIAHSSEILAERVMEFDRNTNDLQGEKTAKIMRDDYQKLYDKMRSDGFYFTNLTKSDYTKILVGALIVTNNLEDRIKNEQLVVKGYKNDVIPKLQRIIDETKTDEEAYDLSSKIFQIKENN